MNDKLKDFLYIASLAALMQGFRYRHKRRGEEISYLKMLSAMLTAAIVGVLVNIGMEFLGIDRHLIIVAVAIAGYLGGSLLDTVSDGVVSWIRDRLHSNEKDEQ